MKKIIILIFLTLLYNITYSTNSISLGTYKKYISKLKKGKNIKINSNSENTKCIYLKDKGFYYITPSCFLKNKLPKIEFKKTVDIIWPYITGFSEIYDLNKTEFYYRKAKIYFSYNWNLKNYIGKDKYNKILLKYLIKNRIYIKVPIEFLAFNQIKKYTFYISDKSLEKRNRARLINFNVAINALNNYVLKPKSELYFNKLIAYKKGYVGNGKYAFYGGVCGASTLLFRNALLNPFLYVKERKNHRERYAYFYSNYIYGDDSSVYNFDKKLKIVNLSKKHSIIFKKKKIGEKIYLVSIYPSRISATTYIKKKEIGNLNSFLVSSVYSVLGKHIYSQSWTSYYEKKNWEK